MKTLILPYFVVSSLCANFLLFRLYKTDLELFRFKFLLAV